MKKSAVPFLFVILSQSFSQFALAEIDLRQDDRQQFRAMLVDIETGINTNNLNLVLQHLEQDVIITYQNGEVARGKEAVIAFNKRMMDGPDAVVKSLYTKAKVSAPALFYGDTAIAYGISTDHMKLAGGLEFKLDAHWSTTLIKKQGTWKAAAIHFSTNVLDNEIVNKTKKMVWIAGIGTGIVGLALGFLFGRTRKNK